MMDAMVINISQTLQEKYIPRLHVLHQLPSQQTHVGPL